MIIKTIIAGSRGFCNEQYLFDALKELPWQITEVVSGRAKGADQLGEKWARKHHIPCRFFPADWSLHGAKAGPIRNHQMAQYAEAVVVLIGQRPPPASA